jgi:hypothetical protein
MLTGGCFCGAIRYEVEGTPFHATNCHCSICRRTTGAPFVTWFSVRPSDFRIVEGEPMRFNSTERYDRSVHDVAPNSPSGMPSLATRST